MTQNQNYTVMFSAGESSGEQHAANMFTELKRYCPSLHGIGMGGPKMKAAGIKVIVDSSAIGVIGLIEVLKHYGDIRAALQRMKALLDEAQPDLLICVDYKEFNLKLAQYAKKQGIKVLFYVSPQVWAWRPGRVKTYGQAIDMMAVIFPFETAYYEAENVPVRYVGHPSVDKVQPKFSKEEDFRRYQLDPDRPVLGILPGSRLNEIRRLLPVMLQAAKALSEKYPQLQFVLPQADSISDEVMSEYLKQSDLTVKTVKGEPYDVVQCCRAVMTASGTASLEVALLKVPMVIVYKLSGLTYWLGRLLVKTPFIGLPNIVAGKAIVKELIQHDVSEENLVSETEKLLFERSYRESMIAGLTAVKKQLGQGGGSRNMAALAAEMLRASDD